MFKKSSGVFIKLVKVTAGIPVIAHPGANLNDNQGKKKPKIPYIRQAVEGIRKGICYSEYGWSEQS
ncbi:MAG: hypothetical protein WCP79_00030 [Bacillota bacterium]